MVNKTKTFQNIRIPTIGLGTHNLQKRECKIAVSDAINLGYRHIDTAQAYENEVEVGQGIIESGVPREEIFLTTKIWHDKLDPAGVRNSFEKSLKKLQTEYTDLILIHWPSPEHIPMENTLEVMMELKEDGKTRHIGVSNFTPSLIKKAMNLAPVVCNQIEYHPYLDQDDILKICKENDMAVVAYSPLAQGKVFKSDVLSDLAKRHDKNEGQIALRWLIQQDQVVAIPRSSDSNHRKSNFDIFDFELEGEEMKAIDELKKREERLVDPEFAPKWSR